MRTLSLLAALTFGLPAFAADDAYDLRGPAPKKGLTVTRTSEMKIKDADVTVTVMGMKIDLKQTLDIVGEEVDEVLEVKGREIVKAKTTLTKETVNTTSSINGNEMKEDKTSVLQGERIIAEKGKDGKWKNALEDGKPSDEQKKELAKREGPDSDDDVFPEGKVKVGHAWKVDASKIKSVTGGTISEPSGEMKLKFLKVEKVDGDECAVIEISGTIKGKMKEDGAPDLEMAITSTGWRSLKTGLEVKSTITGTMKIEGTIKMGDDDIALKFEGKFEGTGTASIKK